MKRQKYLILFVGMLSGVTLEGVIIAYAQMGIFNPFSLIASGALFGIGLWQAGK